MIEYKAVSGDGSPWGPNLLNIIDLYSNYTGRTFSILKRVKTFICNYIYIGQ